MDGEGKEICGFLPKIYFSKYQLSICMLSFENQMDRDYQQSGSQVRVTDRQGPLYA